MYKDDTLYAMTQPENRTNENNDNDSQLGVLNPLPLAEQLSLDDLNDQLTFAHNNTADWQEDKRFLRQACAELEMSLALPPNDDRAIDHFDDFELYLERIIDNPDAHYENMLDAHILIASKGLLKQRQQKVYTVDEQQKETVRHYLGDLVQKVDDLERHASVKRGQYAKIAVHALMNRTSLSYYPATTRERQSRIPDYTPLHHDGYAVIEGSKVPVKSRGSLERVDEYSSKICFLPYKQLVLLAFEEITGTKNHPGALAEEFVYLLEEESRGETLREYERQWLDKATEFAELEVREFYEEVINPSE